MLGVLTLSTTKEAPVSEFYKGQQFVGMDLHRRRSVLVRMTETGEHLETVRIVNTRDRLASTTTNRPNKPESSTSLFDLPAPEQHAPNGVAVKALRP